MSRNHFKVSKGVSLTPVTSQPSDPENGDIIYNNTSSQFEKYQNGAWGALGGSSGVYTPTAPTIQIFYSGTGTYTTPANISYLEVELVGAGGGGYSTAIGSSATDGTLTSFGSTLIIGYGGFASLGQPGTGNSSALTGGAIGVTLTGDDGSSINYGNADGGDSFFGGRGRDGISSRNAKNNTGSGGAGNAGAGGGAGGYAKAFIYNPTTSYSYSVGIGGTGFIDTMGMGMSNGGNGADGIIIVREYYK